MKITIKTITKETYMCDLEPISSVLELKKVLHSLSGIESDYNRLIYSGKFLRDDDLISDIGYKSTDFIVMMRKRHKDAVVTSLVPQTSEKQGDPSSEDLNSSSNLETSMTTSAELTINVSASASLTTDTSSSSIRDDDDWGEDSQEDEIVFSPLQIMQLMHVMTNDPTISQILNLHPQLRTELRNPNVLLELLRRMEHPIMQEFSRNKFTKPGQVNRTAIGGKNCIKPPRKDKKQAGDVESDPIDAMTIEEISEEMFETEENGVSKADDILEESGDTLGLPEVVHITQSEFDELSKIKSQIKEILGELSISDNQLNGIIYEVYKMLNKDADATRDFVINRIIDEGL